MTFSPLTAYTRETLKRSSRQGNKPRRLIIHHTAGGSLASNLHTLSAGPAKKSATYLLDTPGDLIGLVPEEFRPWTSGSFTADGPAITVETINTTGAPTWRVSDAQIETLAQLAADCSRRYGWGRLTRDNVQGHRDYAATACPGPYLYPRLDHIINRANAIRGGATTQEDDMGLTDEQATQLGEIHGALRKGRAGVRFPGDLRTAIEKIDKRTIKITRLVEAIEGADPEQIATALLEDLPDGMADQVLSAIARKLDGTS